MDESEIPEKDENTSAISEWLKNFLENHPAILKTVKWLVPLLLILVSLATVYWAWFEKLPPIMDLPDGEGEGRGALFLFLPIVCIIASGLIIDWLTKVSDKSFQTLLKIKGLRKDDEVKFRESLAASALGHIVDMITYSRNELEIYYQMGISQQRKSYRYSVWAMSIGFIVIMAGIALYMVSPPFINQKYLEGDLQILTIGSGLLMELVGGLFFFMYRESSRKLTYLYNRQNVLYDSLICLEIAKEEKGDQQLKQMIVSNILSQTSISVHSSWWKKGDK